MSLKYLENNKEKERKRVYCVKTCYKETLDTSLLKSKQPQVKIKRSYVIIYYTIIMRTINCIFCQSINLRKNDI